MTSIASFQYGHRTYTPVPNEVLAEVLAVLRAAMTNDPAAAGAWGALVCYSPLGDKHA